MPKYQIPQLLFVILNINTLNKSGAEKIFDRAHLQATSTNMPAYACICTTYKRGCQAKEPLHKNLRATFAYIIE